MTRASKAMAIGAEDNRRARVLVTPEGLPLPMTLGTRGARAGALIIDLVILSISLLIFNIALDLVMGGTIEEVGAQASSSSGAATEFLIIVSVIAGFAAWYGYFLVQELSPRGATLGKRLVGLRVAARGGDRLTPEAIIARNLLRDVEIFYPLIFVFVTLVLSIAGEVESGFVWAGLGGFLLFALFPFLNKDALRAGDIIAGTWVVEAPKAKLGSAISTQGSAARQGASEITGARYDFGEAELSVYGERELQTLERLLREGNDDALGAVHATISRKLGWEPGEGDDRAFLEAFYAQLRARLETDMRFGKRKADKHS